MLTRRAELSCSEAKTDLLEFCGARESWRRTVNLCRRRLQTVPITGSPLVIGVEDTEDSKPKDGRR